MFAEETNESVEKHAVDYLFFQRVSDRDSFGASGLRLSVTLSSTTTITAPLSFEVCNHHSMPGELIVHFVVVCLSLFPLSCL